MFTARKHCQLFAEVIRGFLCQKITTKEDVNVLQRDEIRHVLAAFALSGPDSKPSRCAV